MNLSIDEMTATDGEVSTDNNKINKFDIMNHLPPMRLEKKPEVEVKEKDSNVRVSQAEVIKVRKMFIECSCQY